jgi:hypothetical protein
MKRKRTDKDTLDIEWAGALESLQQFRDPLGILHMIADDAEVPQWVRGEVKEWLEGCRPARPSALTDKDQKLLDAVQAYRTNARPSREKKDDRITRIAKEHEITRAALDNYLNCKGGTYKRVAQAWREWEAVSIDKQEIAGS